MGTQTVPDSVYELERRIRAGAGTPDEAVARRMLSRLQRGLANRARRERAAYRRAYRATHGSGF